MLCDKCLTNKRITIPINVEVENEEFVNRLELDRLENGSNQVVQFQNTKANSILTWQNWCLACIST